MGAALWRLLLGHATDDLAAYEAYLRGLAAGMWDYDPGAADAFAEAAHLDPAFAAAFAQAMSLAPAAPETKLAAGYVA